MTRLLIGNIAPETTDEEIKAFLAKYGFSPFDNIEHLPGDGSRPAVVLTYQGVDLVSLGELQRRVHDVYWKGRTLNVQVMRDSFA